jgi:hypothetical protein
VIALFTKTGASRQMRIRRNDLQSKDTVMNADQQTAQRALGRLISIASRDTGLSRHVANFLLAWHNAEENGGSDPVDLWNVDADIAADMLTLLQFIRECSR